VTVKVAAAAASVDRDAKAVPKAKATHLVLSCGPSYFQHRSISIGEETCARPHHPPPPATAATAAASRVVDGVSCQSDEIAADNVQG